MKKWICGAILFCAGGVHAQQEAVWRTGAAGLWTDASNWEPGVVPDNQGGLRFNATINSGETTVSGLNTIRIDSLTLGGSSRLAVSGGALRVLGDFVGTTEVRVTGGGLFNAGDSLATMGAGPLVLRAEGAGSTARLGGAAIIPITQFQTRGFSFGAFSGGTIDLPTLRHVDTEEMFSSSIFNDFAVEGAGSSLLLPELETIRTRASGGGPVRLSVSAGGLFSAPMLQSVEGNVTVLLQGGGSMSLPSLESFEGGLIHLNGPNASFSAPAIARFDNTRLLVLAGNTLDLGAAEYRWTSTLNTSGFGPLFQASGAGSVLRLHLERLDFGAGPNLVSDEIASRQGGLIDLPELVSLTGSSTSDLRISVNNARLEMPSLASISGRVAFSVTDSDLELPRLKEWDQLTLELRNAGASISLPSAPNLDETRILLTAGATFDFPFERFRSGLAVGEFSDFAVFDADGVGSALNAASLRRIDARFDRDGDAQNQSFQVMIAEHGARMDFTGLKRVDGPLIPDHHFRMKGLSGAQFEFGGLRITNNVGIVLGSSASASFAGDVAFLDGSFLHSDDGVINLQGNLLIRSTSVSDFVLSDTVFHFLGLVPQRFEAISADAGLGGSAAGDQRLGSLTVGSESQTSVLRLIDQVDNAPGEDAEAAYFGSLTLLNDSTLRIDALNAYVGFGVNTIHLNALFAPGETRIAFSDGFVEIPSPGPMALISVLGAFTLRRRR